MKNLTAGLMALTACVDVPTSALLEDVTPEAVQLPPGSCCVLPAPPPIEEHEGDRRTLEAFYEAATGSGWTVQDGWLVDSVPLAEWAGVTMRYDSITGKLRVTRLVMDPANNLRGIRGIPKVLADLEGLRVLDLRNARWGAGGGLPLGLRPDGWLTYRPTAVPRELMGLPLDSLRLGFDGHCLPASDTALIKWVSERENYRVTPICLNASDFKQGGVMFVQGTAVSQDSLMYDRDTWIAYAPVPDTAAISKRRRDPRLNDSTKLKPSWRIFGPPWPALSVEVCQSVGDCVTLPMAQGTDSTSSEYPELSHYRVERRGGPPLGSGFVRYRNRTPSLANRFDWTWDVGAVKVPGELVQPGTTIAVEAWSPTHGDTVLLDRIEVAPALEAPLLRVVVVPIASDPSDSATVAYYDLLKSDEALRNELLFAELVQWFPVRLAVQWYEGGIVQGAESCTNRDPRCRASADLANVNRLRAEAGDTESYWLGLGQWGFIGGVANQGGYVSVSSVNGVFVAHEIGHNLGLGHPNEECDPFGLAAECSDHRDKIRAVAVGEWIPLDSLDMGGIPGDAGQTWRDGREYLPTLRNPFAATFMQSGFPYHGARSARSLNYPSIAPWQWQVIHRRLTGGVAADRQPVVVVNQ